MSGAFAPDPPIGRRSLPNLPVFQLIKTGGPEAVPPGGFGRQPNQPGSLPPPDFLGETVQGVLQVQPFGRGQFALGFGGGLGFRHRLGQGR